MESLTPILIYSLLAGAAALVLYVVYTTTRWLWQSFRRWHYNFSRPVATYPARVVVKRTETTGQMSTFHHGGRVDTWYYVTFEFTSGERREYEVSGADYGLVTEGDQGHLTFKGTEFYGFEREGGEGLNCW
jgi:hypothetical protein